MKQAASALQRAAAPAEFALPVTLRLVDQMREPILAHIRRVNTGFFLIASPEALKLDQRLDIIFEGRLIESQVVYCHPQLEGGHHLGVRMTYDADRPLRTEPRIPLNMPVEVTVAGMHASSPAHLVNISASGLGLDVDRHIAAGEMVYVKLENGFAFGEIRHCSKLATGYRVGLKLDEFIALHDDRCATNRRSVQPEKPSALARFFGIGNSSRS